MEDIISGIAIALLIICLLACGTYSMFNSNALPYTVLVPAGYGCTLKVVYNEKCGLKPIVKEGRKLLKFNKHVFLIVTSPEWQRK